jgi:uncharacterized phage-associated protein
MCVIKVIRSKDRTMHVILEKRILSCFDVANYFLVLVDREAGDTITQLKLQKLIYFAQGISLALLDRPLFNEEIEAWKQEAVVRVLQKIFDNFKYVNMLYNFRTNNFAFIISCKCRRGNFVYSLFSKSK